MPKNTKVHADVGIVHLLAEALSRVATSDAETYIPRIKVMIQSLNVLGLYTVQAGLFSTFFISFVQENWPLIENALRPTESGLPICKAAIDLVSSLVSNQSNVLILPPGIVQTVQECTIVNESWIRTVEMGPFKHKVDEGALVRLHVFQIIKRQVLQHLMTCVATTITDILNMGSHLSQKKLEP